MGKRIRALAVVLAGVSILVLCFAAPQSRWIVKNNVDALAAKWSYKGPNYTPAYEPHGLLDPGTYLNTENGSLARALDTRKGPADLTKLRKLAEARPDDPVLWAHVARLSVRPFRLDGRKGLPLGAAHQSLIEATENGKRLEPNNMYFPILRACAYAEEGKHREAADEVELAALLPIYRDYVSEDADARRAAMEERYGFRGEYPRLLSASQTIWPHMIGLRDLSFSFYGRADAATIVSLLKCAQAAAKESDSLIGVLMASNVPWHVLLEQPIYKPDRVSELVLKAHEIDKEVGGKEAVESVDYLLAMQGAWGEYARMQERAPNWTESAVADVLGAPILGALLVLPILTLLLYVAGRAGKASGSYAPIPQIVTSAANIIVFANLRAEDLWCGPAVLTAALCHITFAFMYGAESTARRVLFGSFVAFCLWLGYAALTEPTGSNLTPLLVGLLLIGLLVRTRSEKLTDRANELGWLVAGYTLVLALATQNHVLLPLALFALTKVVAGIMARLRVKAWVPAILLIVLSLACGYLLFLMQAGGFDDTNLIAIVIGFAVLIALLVCRVQPLRLIHVAAAVFTLSILFLGTTGYALAKNRQVGNLSHQFLNSGDQIRSIAEHRAKN